MPEIRCSFSNDLKGDMSGEDRRERDRLSTKEVIKSNVFGKLMRLSTSYLPF